MDRDRSGNLVYDTNFVLTLTMPNSLNRIIHIPFLALSNIIFRDIKMKTLKLVKLVSQQYRAWSDCMDVQDGLALYWWQRLITFSSGRIRVKI